MLWPIGLCCAAGCDWQEWDREWDTLVKAAASQLRKNAYYLDVMSYLEEIHVFTLANVLRRPIIVLGEPFTYGRDGESIEQNNFVGIYLPLLWKPTSCYPYPVVIAFSVDHFQPLLGRARSSLTVDDSVTYDAVPLVTADLEPLRIHFLLPDEQGSVANNILQQYLRTCEVTDFYNLLSIKCFEAFLVYCSVFYRSACFTKATGNC